MTAPHSYVRTQPAQTYPSPIPAHGFMLWLRHNLCGNTTSTVLTALSVMFLLYIISPLWHWLVSDAVWSAADGAACRVEGTGACWAFIAPKIEFFIYGSYPRDYLWRVNTVFGLGFLLMLWCVLPHAPYKKIAAFLFFCIFPFLAFVLLHGNAALNLAIVDTDLWGGILVSLLVSTIGIVTSLPLGIVLALGRRSSMPIIRTMSIGFIEFVRGVPLITVLFMANTMLPLFIPENWSPDRLVRPLIGVSLFAAAYMSEVVRGGLQALPKGQEEAALALGMTYWQRMCLVVLPQALKIVIPGIVNTFIGLFKDTTLVAIVGIFDFLRTVDTARLDPQWAGPSISATGYVFAALFYFIFCFLMSRYSHYLEQHLASEQRARV
jgi:general L-amino acid transport system permease protein